MMVTAMTMTMLIKMMRTTMMMMMMMMAQFTFIVDLTVPVNIGFPDHLIHLFIGELLSQVGHHMPELSRGDETVAILVEDAERLPDLLLAVCVLHLPGHHGEELGEVDRAVAVGVNLVDHVLQLGLSGVLAQGPHHRSELLGGDGAVAILVEEGERLLELRDLLLGQLVSHFRILVSQSLGGGVWE